MLTQFEGKIFHLYLDSKGNPTCGVGHLLSSPESACDLPFTLAAGAILASRADILAEYAAVRLLEPNMRPMYYTLRTKLRLSDEAVDALLEHDIAQMSAVLKQGVEGFAAYPDPAQTALMDMAFNLGGSGLLHGYPKLLQACKWQEWRVAASECHRKGIPEDRNAATAALFRGLATKSATVA